jgi:hypothetical protein
MLHYAGTSENLEALVLAANRVLFYSGSSGIVSQRWEKRWMIRYTEFLKTLKTKPMHVKRLAAHVVEDVNDHLRIFVGVRINGAFMMTMCPTSTNQGSLLVLLLAYIVER